MPMEAIPSANPIVELVPPNPERDTPHAMRGFADEAGKRTLLLMGNPERVITPTSYQKEHDILSSFVELAQSGERLTWMMSADDKTIGAIWVELKAADGVPTPAVSVMIGDPAYRGQGLGRAAMVSVIDHLKANTDYENLYARRLTDNTGSAALLDSLGFTAMGGPYTDEDGLTFQNFQCSLR